MIVVGTTLTTFSMSRPEVWGYWLRTAEQMKKNSPEPLHFFAAIEVDARGLLPLFQPLISRLEEIGGSYWTYNLDDGRTEIKTSNRLRHITMGQNLVSDFASSNPEVTHLLFMAADCMPPADTIPKLLELDHPLVGGEVTTYVLSGPKVDKYLFPVEEHMATAAFILIRRDVFTRLRWRWGENGMSDDPSYHYDAINLLGIPTYVRKDCKGRHYPEAIGALETRGYDRKVIR